jgi:radical SAM superfamily enzyme with C-terminal helix-hairpin-helix motif
MTGHVGTDALKPLRRRTLLVPRLGILDGYVDEPAQFGVPPYVSPQARYIWGAARAAGLEGTDGATTPEIEYLTIDQARKDPRRLGALLASEVLVVLASCVVPGKYLRGAPITRDETARALMGAKQRGGFTILAGACARFGFGQGGGRPLLDLKPLEAHLDRKCPDHADAFVHDLFLAMDNRDEPPGPYGQRKRTPEEWDRFALLGADLVTRHSDHPEPLTAEIDTYTGCARYVDGGCKFCMEPLEGKPRYRDEAQIQQEMKRLWDLGVRSYRLGGQACFYSYKAKGVGTDPDPEPDIHAIKRLLTGIRDVVPEPRVLHIDNANPTVIAKHPDAAREVTRLLVEHMSDGNVAAFGLESMDPEVQRINNLNTDHERALLATRILNEEGAKRGPSGQPWILPGYNFISGLPGESKKTTNYNLKFLQKIRDEGLLVRRVNLRQLLPSRKGMPQWPKLSHHEFVSFKKKVRDNFDHPMLQHVYPPGTQLRDVYTETRDGHTTFGRQLGSYPILVGIPYEMPLETFLDVVITDHGYRSITGFVTPFPTHQADLRMWQALPGIGKKRALDLKMRPPKDLEDLRKRIDDQPVVEALAPHLRFGETSEEQKATPTPASHRPRV